MRSCSSFGFMFCFRLCGYSPFAGETDRETFENITGVDFYFDDEVWDAVSDDAKDFISQLLMLDKK